MTSKKFSDFLPSHPTLSAKIYNGETTRVQLQLSAKRLREPAARQYFWSTYLWYFSVRMSCVELRTPYKTSNPTKTQLAERWLAVLESFFLPLLNVGLPLSEPFPPVVKLTGL